MQKLNLTFAVFLIFLATILIFSQSNSWHGITPLVSTRADVEKIFGKPTKDGYKTVNERFSFSYIDYKCELGWNVPKDTVYSISVITNSDVGKSFDELKLDRTKFSSSIDDAFFGTWTNAEDGLSYYFSNVEREFIDMSYVPRKADNNLRCSGFPPYATDAQYFTMEIYSFHNPKIRKTEDLNWLKAHLDSFISSLINADLKQFNGYALIYFDNKLSLKGYQLRLNLIKNYCYKTRKIPKGSLMFIEGGMKEQSEIRFYILPKDWKPPAPNPTLPSPQFMRKN